MGGHDRLSQFGSCDDIGHKNCGSLHTCILTTWNNLNAFIGKQWQEKFTHTYTHTHGSMKKIFYGLCTLPIDDLFQGMHYVCIESFESRNFE